MKADDELYCRLLDWRDELRERHNDILPLLSEKARARGTTFHSALADEIDQTLAACDKAQRQNSPKIGG